jgi:hypothetical protein
VRYLKRWVDTLYARFHTVPSSFVVNTTEIVLKRVGLSGSIQKLYTCKAPESALGEFALS